MLRIDLVTCLPELVRSPLEVSILARAQKKGLVEIVVQDLHQYATDKHHRTDDYPYGGGAGMVLSVPPIANCIRTLQSQRRYDETIFLTPDGELFTQKLANELSLKKNLILLAGHYKGVDQRARDLFVTKEISIGDFVLTGGELPALVVIDAIVRLVPGVLNDATSALSDSFMDGLLAPPVYTRPADFEGHSVPEVLLSGNFALIEQWREQKALEKTKKLRPDLLKSEDV
ncbi:MAG: tRNA (guanosine(37)-N1)-methyltransferase TrmD [Bacteroidia bacterium]|nr:tRNA (guanosine(37)-N1)-methyltransferase TrmD [Bacteroidia bacterium]